MTIIRGNNPSGELLSLRHAMDRLFQYSSVRPGSRLGDRASLIAKAALPGVKPPTEASAGTGTSLVLEAQK